MKDFIIVGAGLAGISFAETALLNNKSFVVISDASENSSIVAAGIYNPVIVKRLSTPQDVAAHMEYIVPFYNRIEERLNSKVKYDLPLYRRFASIEEQNNWFEATDKPTLEPFLSTAIVHKKYDCLPSPFGFGEVKHTGYVDTADLVSGYMEFLKGGGNYINETFDHSGLIIEEDRIIYKGIEASHIIFAEGFGIHKNPFFNYLPLGGTKGELLIIKAPKLQLDAAINAGIFILPLGSDLYKVGATYEWLDKTSRPTEAGKQELIERLAEVITCEYEILEHLAGIRPTVKDRKPLIGTHPEFKRIHLLNGLGTRGVILGPPMARDLYDAIVFDKPIKKEINLERFKK